MQDSWERGRDVIRESVKLLKAGKKERALKVVDTALAEAIHENHRRWALTLCRHAAIIAHSMRDYARQIDYEEKALPFAEEYRFAAYNFSQLLLKHGQVDRAEQYADEARLGLWVPQNELDWGHHYRFAVRRVWNFSATATARPKHSITLLR